jgi:hypothetical protein
VRCGHRGAILAIVLVPVAARDPAPHAFAGTWPKRHRRRPSRHYGILAGSPLLHPYDGSDQSAGAARPQRSVNRMANRMGRIVGPAALGMLLLAACHNIPYYDESLNWFSWSEYDPQIKAIEAQTPPPGALEADGRAAFMGDGSGAVVHSAASPRVPASPGATPRPSGTGIAAAGNAHVSNGPGNSTPNSGSPLVGIRNSVGGSVTWRSPRGTP